MGAVRFNLDTDFLTSAKITVTKDDFKPYQASLSVANESLSVNLSMSSDIIILDSNDNIPKRSYPSAFVTPKIHLIGNPAETSTSVSHLQNIIRN